MKDIQQESIRHELAALERRVLDEVWIGGARWAGYVVLVILVFVSAAAWSIDVVGAVSGPGSNRVPVIAALALVAAAALSAFALIVRRFRECCAAAYVCGLSAVIGIGALWWLRTGRPDAPMAWLVVADMAAVLLTIGWLSVVVKPLEHSQPEMRAAYREVDS
ncbi:hypothetical protein [Mycolicibacterium aichiense]|uniref:hypothetical protein n=1 Tax=Mycolicibacterium aichiense TaxID=1799 RepID=UPI000E1B7484|nr:hypothetical protein [Mycolicibacterium aichiense]MCV7021589.1 hypothetical protein [Mycolicibacterium aichiense]